MAEKRKEKRRRHIIIYVDRHIFMVTGMVCIQVCDKSFLKRKS